jgi:amino acid transporter
MKTLRSVLLIALLAFVIAGLFFYLTDGTIAATWQSKLGEIATIALVIFVVLMIIYIIAKSAVKSTMALRKKRPPQNGGPQV